MIKSYSNLYGDKNEIEIYNNTSYALTVRYSGPMSKKIVLNSKETKIINLNSGKYRVAASVNNPNVQSYAGEEELTGGGYSVVYYIITSIY